MTCSGPCCTECVNVLKGWGGACAQEQKQQPAPTAYRSNTVSCYSHLEVEPACLCVAVCCRWEERELPHHNWTKFIDAKRKELQRLNNAYKNTLSNAQVELLQGFGKVVDPHTVDVDGKKYTVRSKTLWLSLIVAICVCVCT